MKTTVLKYSVIIRKEGRDFIADVPTLGISDFGASVETARQNVQKAILCHLEGLAKTKTAIPRPDTENFYLTPTEVVLKSDFRFAF